MFITDLVFNSENSLKTLHNFLKPSIKLKKFKENMSALSVYSSYHIFICRKDPVWSSPKYLLPPFNDEVWTMKQSILCTLAYNSSAGVSTLFWASPHLRLNLLSVALVWQHICYLITIINKYDLSLFGGCPKIFFEGGKDHFQLRTLLCGKMLVITCIVKILLKCNKLYILDILTGLDTWGAMGAFIIIYQTLPVLEGLAC